VGAGLAGLICAQKLQRAGYQVAVLEKSRGLGGRLATRRVDGVAIVRV
jgi:renalase